MPEQFDTLISGFNGQTTIFSLHTFRNHDAQSSTGTAVLTVLHWDTRVIPTFLDVVDQ